jgi:anthranilate synthase/aminodeoxychorismate synthase-like glutamine amidotransferase
MTRVLFIDNFDSFTYNLVDEFEKRGCEVMVYRNDISLGEFDEIIMRFVPSLLVFSPGPSTPRDAGNSLALMRAYKEKIAMFGVCLGHQCMIEAFGGRVGYAGDTVHGKVSQVWHDGKGIYDGVANPLSVGRYHSLAGLEIPDELEVTARCGNLVMGIAHRKLPITGVQYHPESILTAGSDRIFKNLLLSRENDHA